MCKLLFLNLILLCFTSTLVIGQTPATPIKNIFWSDDSICGERNFDPGPDEFYSCQSAPVGNVLYRQLRHNNLTINTKLYQTGGDHYIAELRIINNSDKERILETKDWHIIYYSTEKDYALGNAPVSTKFFQESPKFFPRALTSGEPTNMGVSVIRNHTTGMLEIRPNTTGGSNSTFATSSRSFTTEQSSIKAKTVPPNDSVVGSAYFSLVKSPDFRLIVLKIDGQTYTFPVAKRKPDAPPYTASVEVKPKKLFWSVDAVCGEKNSSITADDNFRCSEVAVSDSKRSRFDYQGLALTSRIYPEGKRLAVEIEVDNQTKAPVQFDTTMWSAVFFENEAAFKGGRSPIAVNTRVRAASAALGDGKEILSDFVRVGTNEKRKGTVYFELPSTGKHIFVSMPIGDVYYVFPMKN